MQYDVKENTVNLISSQEFNTLVDMIPKGVYADFLKDIKSQMGWKGRMFYNKYHGTSKLTPPESILAREIFRKYKIDSYTFQYL